MNKIDQNAKFRRYGERGGHGYQVNHTDTTMDCSWCKQRWITAKLETLKSHETSHIHIKNRDIVAGELKVAGGYETEASKCVEAMNKSIIDKLSVLFRNAHALSLAGRPFSHFQLDTVKGLDIGKTYLNRKRAKEFTSYMANIILNNIKNSIDQAKCVSIMSDGSTDSSRTEIEIIYTRICVNGVVQVFTICLYCYLRKIERSSLRYMYV